MTKREALLQLFGDETLTFDHEDDEEVIHHEQLGIYFHLDPVDGDLLSVVNPWKESLESLAQHRHPHPVGMMSRVVALCEAYGYDIVIECARNEKAARIGNGLVPADRYTQTRLDRSKERK